MSNCRDITENLFLVIPGNVQATGQLLYRLEQLFMNPDEMHAFWKIAFGRSMVSTIIQLHFIDFFFVSKELKWIE